MPDSLITRKFSVPELSQKILEMASTGVYRESIFEALQPVATKKQIREAIAHAKRFGLGSVASLRDPELGTYYQLDRHKYQSLQHLLHDPACAGKDGELTQRLTNANQTIGHMLIAAGSFGGLFGIFGVLCWVSGWHQVGVGLLGAAVSALVLWQFQRQIAQNLERY
ncbi:hypothetical protein HJG54_07155 [Leptolyngbya sp. NK1-12]|uniref:Uncharacterized protein n=1 Tax=Leptolyngbya sp. NK1-12 TaxID=2547451 RepID=A0AA96WDP0_9CYAN|nr:hypothetical protein [Leptolyngbya sp. NK1-12]WNZ22655.1 hypothetical protein HJG54_07155 [Leptolyngbya sp. NK1-12]